jgi:very-short-patch-repair endonuclease
MVYLGKSKTKDMFVSAKPELFRFARTMRKEPTESERILWERLRKMRSEGFIFRRQHPIDIFITDFYCHKIRLVIEVDGEIHDQVKAQEYDDGRSGELERYGLKVIRFKNEEILDDINLVMSRIHSTINEITSPSPSGRGGMRG